MLRAFVVVLLIANLAFFGWSQGWLDGIVGVRANGDREPERLAQQVKPDSIVILGDAASSAAASGAARTPVAAAAGASCLEAGPYTAAEAAAAEAALQGIAPAGSWNDLRSDKPGTWLVYMGSYPDREAMLRKEEEIGRGRAELEEIAVPGEGPFGLALGRFSDRADAERALAQLQQRGIRTARVVQLDAPAVTHRFRFEGADAALAARLAAAKNEAFGKGFAACATH